jgi:AraC family transcriptional regulator of adaptative response / DNA-3-methyladenine glycosylase II
MNEEQYMFYKALASRDPRFDGVFFVGVTSTGIYCRPICTAKLPKVENCRFFKSAEAAEKEWFRPCLRCRPELAPGNAPIDNAHRIANLLITRIGEEQLEEGAGLEDIAMQFGLSSRQLRRIVQKEFGVSPMELVLTRRLLLAKQLLTETDLSITDIAFASGFLSLRRFNDAFKKHYGMPPSRLKHKAKSVLIRSSSSDTITLQLSYRPPYDWLGLLDFLAKRTLKGVEWVEENSYSRTVQIGPCKGWVHIYHLQERNALVAEISFSLLPVLSILLERLRNIFDLNARPDLIATQLRQDPLLTDVVAQNPGLRVPGAFDGFELAIRAILGQQITVKAATALAGRFAAAFGEKIDTPYLQLHHLCPTPLRIASLQMEEIAALGIIRSRAQSIIELAKKVSSNVLKLEASAPIEPTLTQLTSIPGIGKWTGHYIAMRALRWPDAFPKEDIALRKKLGGVTAKQAEEMSQVWRPWRSYALLYLWKKVHT